MISKSFLIMLFTFFMSITFPANSDFYDLSFESIDGNTISLKEFKNKPIIVVNSAEFTTIIGLFLNSFNEIVFPSILSKLKS